MAPSYLMRRVMPQPPPHTVARGDIYYISQSHLYAVIWVGTFLAACFTALRTCLQYAHNRRFYTNDYLISLAMFFHIITSILYQLIGPPMYEMEPILSGLEKPSPSQFGSFDYDLRLQFAITVMSWATLWSVKLALLTFFWRLFDSVRTHARVFWWVMCGITISTFVISVFLFGFACQPLGSFFDFGGCSTPGNVRRGNLSFHFSSVTDIITDFFIMLTPFPLLWKLQINRNQKGILILIFLMPIFVIIFGVLRLIQTNPVIGTVDPIRLAVFSTVQISCSIIAACLPSIRLFFLHKKGKSPSEYHRYRYQKDGSTFGHSATSEAKAHELSNVAEAFPTRGSSGSTEAILTPLEKIHVRRDVLVHSVGI